MDIININGVDLPAPSSLKIQKSDLDSPDTTRNELGILQRDRIREGVYKISLEFNVKKSHEIQLIESAIVDSELTVTFPTPTGMITKKMYVGDRNIDVVLYKGGYDKARWNMNFSLIEY